MLVPVRKRSRWKPPAMIAGGLVALVVVLIVVLAYANGA
jgi:hypothetical protein